MIAPLSAGVLSTLALLGARVDARGTLCSVPFAAAAIVVIASRLAVAPPAVTLLALALVATASLTGRPVAPEGVDPMEAARMPGGFATHGMHLMWAMILASGLVWWDTKYFIRSWEPSRLAQWTLQGLRSLLRPDAGAAWRVIAGSAIVLVFPLAVTFFAPEAVRHSIVTTSMRAPLKSLMLLGTGLLVSGLRLK